MDKIIQNNPMMVIVLLFILLIVLFSVSYIHISKKYVESQKEMQEALLTATTLNRCIHALTYHKNIDEAINELLVMINEFFEGDRAYIFQNDYEKQTTSNLYECVKDGVTPEIEHLQNVPLEVIDYWLDRFKEEGMFSIQNVEEEVDKDSSTYAVLKPQNITSLIAVPLMDGEDITGYLGVDNPKRRYENLSLLSSVVFFISDSMQKKQQEQRLKEMSFKDAMTSIFNRNALIERINIIQKNKEKNIGIAYFDLNGLKKINDVQGHLAGDAALKKVAMLINNDFPLNTFRFGGDEFVVVLTDVLKADFVEMINKTKEMLQDHQISCSMGYSWADEMSDVDRLIKEADSDMYKNKADFYKN